jgi:hypothetical protein
VWAVCRHDHGMTWDEFAGLTLPQLEALEERRMVRVRYARFNAGLVASTIYNANRSGDSEPVEVWDFIPGYGRTEAEKEADKLQASVRQSVRVAFTRMQGKTVGAVRAEAAGMIARLVEGGTDREEAEQLVRSTFEEVIKQPWQTA